MEDLLQHLTRMVWVIAFGSPDSFVIDLMSIQPKLDSHNKLSEPWQVLLPEKSQSGCWPTIIHIQKRLNWGVSYVEPITKADLLRVTLFAAKAKSAPRYGGLVPPFCHQKL